MAEYPIPGDNAPPFQTLGQQLKAIIKACLNPGVDADTRLLEVQKRAAAGGSEAVPSDGGFLLQPEFSRDLVKRMYLTGEVLRRCTPMQMSTGGIKFPQFSETSRVAGSRLGGVQCFYENEAVSLIASKPSFQLSEMAPKKITGLINVTDELAQDSNALASWANYAFSQEGTFKLEAAIVNGTGAGMPLGVTKAPGLVTIAKEVGQNAGTILPANITNMRAALWAAGRRNAVWLYNQALTQQLASLPAPVGTAGSESRLWHWAEGGQDETDRLAGIPAYPSEYCQVPGTLGDLLLVDFSRYVVGFRDQRTDVSIHVNFLSDQSVFKFVLRVDGQPIDQAAVVPDHGTVATSPMVALATR